MPFAHMCTCGLTDWCSGNDALCEIARKEFSESETKKPRQRPVDLAPLLAKFKKEKQS